MEELKQITLELLEKFQESEKGVIHEFSSSPEDDFKHLQIECDDYRKRINELSENEKNA